MPGESVVRIKFWDLFSQSADGILRLEHDLVVNGARFPKGTAIETGRLIAGVDINKRRGQDLAIVTTSDDTYVLRGFYLPDGR